MRPGVVCTEISRPLESNARPFEPLVFSRKVETLLSLSIFVIRLAFVSVKIEAAVGKRDRSFGALKSFLDHGDLRAAFDDAGDVRRDRVGGRWCGRGDLGGLTVRGRDAERAEQNDSDLHGSPPSENRWVTLPLVRPYSLGT